LQSFPETFAFVMLSEDFTEKYELKLYF